MLDNENNRENHPILNQVYDIITKFHNQGKQLTLICKVPASYTILNNASKNGKVDTIAVVNMRSN